MVYGYERTCIPSSFLPFLTGFTSLGSIVAVLGMPLTTLVSRREIEKASYFHDLGVYHGPFNSSPTRYKRGFFS